MTNHFDPRRSTDDALNFRCDSVRILVGPDKDCFSLPRSVITSSAGFLRHRFSNNQNEIHIFETCPTSAPITFNTYANWLHTRTIPLTARAKSPRTGTGSQPEELQSLELGHLYLLGEGLQDEEFKNSVVDALIANFHDGHLPGPICIETIYNWTMEKNDRHRRVLAQAYAKLGNKSHFKSLRDKVPADFFVDVCMALTEVRDPAESTILVGSNCAFHHHFETERCGDDGRPKKRARVEEGKD